MEIRRKTPSDCCAGLVVSVGDTSLVRHTTKSTRSGRLRARARRTHWAICIRQQLSKTLPAALSRWRRSPSDLNFNNRRRERRRPPRAIPRRAAGDRLHPYQSDVELLRAHRRRAASCRVVICGGVPPRGGGVRTRYRLDARGFIRFGAKHIFPFTPDKIRWTAKLPSRRES